MNKPLVKTLKSIFVATAIYGFLSLIPYILPMNLSFTWWLSPSLYTGIILLIWSIYNLIIWRGEPTA